MFNSISTVRVGTWGEVFTVSVEATISAAVETLLRGRISSVAVEANGSVIDVLTRFISTFVPRKSHSFLHRSDIVHFVLADVGESEDGKKYMLTFQQKVSAVITRRCEYVSVFYTHAILLQQEQR